MSDLFSSSAIPLYEQMKDKIKEDIDNGTLVAGSRLPTENELSEQFHVSRVTVRKALEELVSLGYIEKKSAKGTFVTEKKFTRRLSNTSGVSSFTQMCVSNNMVPGAKMIKIALEEPDEAQSKILGISPDKKMVVLERIRLANNQKVTLRSLRMPRKSKHPCGHPGCPQLVEAGQLYCGEHKPLHPDRPSASKRGYGSKWQRVSKAYLRKHPLCVKCMSEGRYVPATVVDHIVPHRGDYYLMWSDTNWQALCKPCHDRKTWSEDRNPVYKY